MPDPFSPAGILTWAVTCPISAGPDETLAPLAGTVTTGVSGAVTAWVLWLPLDEIADVDGVPLLEGLSDPLEQAIITNTRMIATGTSQVLLGVFTLFSSGWMLAIDSILQYVFDFVS